MDMVSPSGTLDASFWISASTSSWHSIKTSTIAWFAFCRFSWIRVPLFNTPEFSDKSPKVSPGKHGQEQYRQHQRRGNGDDRFFDFFLM